jgi:hypothetical protein
MTPDESDTQRLRAIFTDRAESESETAEHAVEDAERKAASRRAEKAEYLKQKLDEQADADAD